MSWSLDDNPERSCWQWWWLRWVRLSWKLWKLWQLWQSWQSWQSPWLHLQIAPPARSTGRGSASHCERGSRGRILNTIRFLVMLAWNLMMIMILYIFLWWLVWWWQLILMTTRMIWEITRMIWFWTTYLRLILIIIWTTYLTCRAEPTLAPFSVPLLLYFSLRLREHVVGLCDNYDGWCQCDFGTCSSHFALVVPNY